MTRLRALWRLWWLRKVQPEIEAAEMIREWLEDHP